MKKTERFQLRRNSLRHSIQFILASTALASGMAHAILRDHGPLSQVDHFPNWYRELAEHGGMAVGQCTVTDDAGNGPLCLTSTADATPGSFAGNIGDEAFFATADMVIDNGAFNILWLGHLEMAYLTADGAPPAVWLANDPQEIVFSRERIRIDTPTTNDGSCAGVYTVRTPYKTHEFDLPEGGRALFYTDDKTAIPGDFQAALKGHAGPFLKWDLGQDGVSPVTSANPAVVFTSPAGQVHKFIGDPNVPHLFVGSTLPAGPGHEDKGFQNYLEVTPPAGCDIGTGTPGAPVYQELASISGLIWDLAIPDPVNVTKAVYTRGAPGALSTAGLDVWAETNSNKNLVLTASNSGSQHLPSVKMEEEIVGGNRTGRYHAHLEIDPTQTVPPSVTVVNLDSNPQSRASSAVADAIVVTKSEYDPVTKTVCVAAHSGDENPPVGHTLSLVSPNYGVAFGPATGTCAGVAPNDLVMEKTLTPTASEKRFAPETVIVQSSLGGTETSQPISKRTSFLDGILSGTVDDSFTNIPGTGPTTLDVVKAGDPDGTAGKDVPPAAFRMVIVGQPEVGTVAPAAVPGSVIYTAETNMDTSDQTFFYALQDTTDPTKVTNVAKVTLGVVKATPPPVPVFDTFGLARPTANSPAAVTAATKTFTILGNDTTGLGTSPIAAGTVELVPAAAGQTVSNAGKTLTTARGTVTVLNDGRITYQPNGTQASTAQNTVETFGYTVANEAGIRSKPAPVNVVYRTAAELPQFSRVRFQTSWTIRWNPTFSTFGITVPNTLDNVVGPQGFYAVLTTQALAFIPETATCSLYASNTAVNPIGTVGTASYTAGGITVLGAGPTPPNGYQVRCAQIDGNTFVSGAL